MLLLGVFTLGVVGHRFAFDFHTYWSSTRAVLDGRSPYPRPSTIATAHSNTGDYEFFVYPPPFALALTPLAAMPFAVAAALYTVFLLACVAGALRVLGVEDWRCYGVAFAIVPVLSSLRLGEITPILLLLVALAWRYRDRWPAAGAAVGGAVVLKLFLWPLVVWLLVTRRWKAAAAACGGGVAATAVAWAAMSFRGLGDYATLLRDLARLEARQSYSLVALAYRFHLPDPQVSWLALAMALVGALVLVCVRERRAAFDVRAYSVAVCVALLLTPILWLNYGALLAAPIALSSPRLSVRWALPLALWLSPFPLAARHASWHLWIVLATVVAVAASPVSKRRLRAGFADIG
jgi:alpha-1,2-mannosyltransferase